MNQWLVFIGINALFVALCVPLIRKEVSMNSVYGFRLPSAMKSDEAWYRVNAFGGKVMATTSVLSIVGLASLRIIGVGEPLFYLSLFVLPIVFTVIAVLIYSNRQA
jgi:hypothetical protein